MQGSFRREMTPALGDAPETGWVLASWAHGRGFATEALRAVLAWADRELAGRTTTCVIDPDNTQSLRVAAKCGYTEFARGEVKGSPVVVLRRNAG